ncbi:MAG TPA: hypothetical protein VFC93_09715 [Chloroflexota bacterium]|nr:hypothetical protein [Chloroflexota bacterium]
MRERNREEQQGGRRGEVEWDADRAALPERRHGDQRSAAKREGGTEQAEPGLDRRVDGGVELVGR